MSLQLTYFIMKRAFKLIALLCCLSCSHGLIERTETAVPDIYVSAGYSGKTIIKNVYTELSVRPVSEKEIRQILSNKSFVSDSAYRIPRLLFFMLTIKNTGELPLFFINGNLLYEKTPHPAVVAEQFRQKFTSPMYDSFDFEKLTAAHRIILPDYEFAFTADTINYKLDFILPDETVARIIAFDYPPPAIIDYRLEFVLKTKNVPRTISFGIKRYEYRTVGGHFIRKSDEYEDFLQ
jgi:hypothetical protein